MEWSKELSVLLVLCVSSCLGLFRDDASNKMTINYSTTVRRGVTNYDYTKLEVEASLLEMLDSPHSIHRDNVLLEFKSPESDWSVLDQSPTMKAGVYKWTISDLVPCHDHNVRLTVTGLDGSQETFLYPSTVRAASMDQIIESRYTPRTPNNVLVEPVTHKVSWSPSPCVTSYDLSYKPVGHTQYTNILVDNKNEETITEILESCTEYEVLVAANLENEFSPYNTFTFTTLPDEKASERLEPVVTAGRDTAVVRWAASEKLSCVPRYEVQLCHAGTGACQPEVTLERDDSVKFMEFSPASDLDMCSPYQLHIRPQHDQAVVSPRQVNFRTKSQPLEQVRSAMAPVQAVLGSDQVVEVSWGAVPCAEEYHVYQRESQEEEWSRLTSTLENSFKHNTKACTRSSYAVAAIIDGEESELVEFDQEILTDINKAELPVIEVVEKANGSMTFVLKTGELNNLCQVDRLHIKYPGGEEFFETANMENGKIVINTSEEGEGVMGRLHYNDNEENDWSPWVSSDSPTKEKQILKQMNFLLPVIIGSVVALVLIITVILVVVKSKKGQAKYDSEKANGTTDESKKLNDSSEEKIINGKK